MAHGSAGLIDKQDRDTHLARAFAMLCESRECAAIFEAAPVTLGSLRRDGLLVITT